MPDNAGFDRLRPGPDIEPFSLNPGGTYDSGFLENLRAYFFNALPLSPDDLHFGPVYRIRTSRGEPLSVFTAYTDEYTPGTGLPAGAAAEQRLWFLAGSGGAIAGFRTLSIVRFPEETGDRFVTFGYIETAQKGRGYMIPLEASARDLLTRVATANGREIRQTVRNDFAVAIPVPGDGSGMTAPHASDEEERWKAAYARLGFRQQSAGEYVYDIRPADDDGYRTYLPRISAVDLSVVPGADGSAGISVAGVTADDPTAVGDVRRREYTSIIYPVLGELCYPDRES